MATRLRSIPATLEVGVYRGGGSEQITYVTNGNMYLIRNYTLYAPGRGIHSGGNNLEVNTHMRTFIPAPALPAGTEKSGSQIQTLGATAMSRSHPTSPSVSFLTSAGELALDGIPILPRIAMWRKETLKALSNAHLSIQFGWLPIKSDIQAYAQQVRDFDRLWKEAQANSQSKSIKVGYTFAVDKTSEKFTYTMGTYNWGTGGHMGDSATVDGFRTFEQRTWYEGSYANYVPTTPSQKSALQEHLEKANVLLGLELTPEVVWNLAPWSWAVDWFTNTGDIISSVSQNLNDGMVLRNGYVMNHFRKEVTATRRGPVLHATKKIPYWTGGEVVRTLSETKRRFRAIPYFGFSSAGELSPKQLSILAALGISRGR